jgi:hypothetical protein
MEHAFVMPNQPLNSVEFQRQSGWDMYLRGESLIVAGDCTRDQAEAALADNIAAAAAAEAERVAAEEAKATAKASAIAKLAALGLTEAEAASLFGI